MTVDYVPSEVDSLLDEEILESIYRVNGHQQTSNDTQQTRHNIPVENIIKEQVIDHWLKKGDSLTVRVLHLELPQRKGRPPPSSTTRIVDDSYCIEFTMPWVKPRDNIHSTFWSINKNIIIIISNLSHLVNGIKLSSADFNLKK